MMHTPPSFGQMIADEIYVDRPAAYALMLNLQGELGVIKTSLGLFLPGGGTDSSETLELALRRELQEEVGYKLIRSQFLCQAVQYVWSEFYQEHFKKIGSFYLVEASPPPQPQFQAGHSLLWMSPTHSIKALSQEFQRWAVAQHFALD